MSKQTVNIGSCTYNPHTRVITRADGSTTKLSRVPADLLELFVNNPLKYFKLSEIEELLWPDKTIEQNTIATWISTLRKELGQTRDEIYIENRRNDGYRLAAAVSKKHPLKNQSIKVVLSSLALFISGYASYHQLTRVQTIQAPQTITTMVGRPFADGRTAS